MYTQYSINNSLQVSNNTGIYLIKNTEKKTVVLNIVK